MTFEMFKNGIYRLAPSMTTGSVSQASSGFCGVFMAGVFLENGESYAVSFVRICILFKL